MDAAAQQVARDAAGRTGPDQAAQHSLQARWHVGLLGGLCLSDGPQRITRLPSRAITALLARLALAPQRAHAREELIELLWPGVARMIVSGRESPQWAAGERDHQVRMGSFPLCGKAGMGAAR